MCNLNLSAKSLMLPVLVVLASLLCVGTRAGERPQKIEFTDPPNTPFPSVTTSNLNRLNMGRSSLNQVKEDLFRPFQSLNPNNSLEAVMPATPFRPAAPSAAAVKKQREQAEQQLD